MATCSTCFAAFGATFRSFLTKGSVQKTSGSSRASTQAPSQVVGLLGARKKCDKKQQVEVEVEVEDSSKLVEREQVEQAFALWRALREQDVVAAIVALENGANPFACFGPDEDTALHLAAVIKTEGNAVLMKLLIHCQCYNRAFLNLQNKGGETALMRCVRADNVGLFLKTRCIGVRFPR